MNLRQTAFAVRDQYRSLRIRLLDSDAKFRRIHGRYIMSIDPTDWMDRAFYFGYYERALLGVLRHLIAPGDVCVDVGAQKGYITLYLASLVGASGSVLAFEPDDNAYQKLIANCAANSFCWVTCYPIALSETTGVRDFAVNRQPGSSSFFPNRFALPTVEKITTINTSTLDRMLEGMTLPKRIRFIKIDAEGAEPLILRGMSSTIERHRPTLSLEINYESLRTAGLSLDSIERPLRAAGYDLFELQSRRRALSHTEPVLTMLSTLKRDRTHTMDVVAIYPDEQALQDCL